MIHSVPAPSFSGETEVTVPEATSDVVLTEGAVLEKKEQAHDRFEEKEEVCLQDQTEKDLTYDK